MKKIRQGNDTFFSVLVFNKKAILSEEATHEEDSAVDLSQVKNLKVQGVRLHPESFFFLPSKVEGNLIKVEFPSERQELGAYDVQIDYDTDNETSEDGLLHHRLRLALCRVIETNDYCNEDSADIDAPIKAYVLDAFKGIQGERGERGQDGINGTNGANGRDGRDGVDGKSALELLNEENSTEHSSITEALKTLMPKIAVRAEIDSIIEQYINRLFDYINNKYSYFDPEYLANAFIPSLNIRQIIVKKGVWYPIINFEEILHESYPIFEVKKDELAELGQPYNTKPLLKNINDFSDVGTSVYSSGRTFFLYIKNKEKDFEFILNFDNTDLSQKIQDLGDKAFGDNPTVLDVNYIVDPSKPMKRTPESRQGYVYFKRQA